MISLTDERLRQLAYDEYVCINETGRAMAVELIAARARIAEIAAMFHLPNDDTLPGRLREVQREVADRIVKLAVESEATQRPPLGYAAVYTEDGRPVRVVEKGTVFADREPAAFYADEDPTLALYELREVQT